jgi:hypothetical protein
MKKHILNFIQLGSIPYTLGIFHLLGRAFPPQESFVLACLAYWLYLTAGITFMLLTDKALLAPWLRFFGGSSSLGISSCAFIPVVGVVFVAFLPVLPRLSMKIFALALFLALFNGLVEEAFWRGLTLAKAAGKNTILRWSSVACFALFHASFLQLRLSFQGGAANLLGSALLMGGLWLYISRKTGTIRYGILAHQLVNVFAFSGLFVLNA